MADTRSETITVVADGWVLDPLASLRLMQQLVEAPASVVGVAASTGPLPPGTSYRVHAERQALLPLSDITSLPDGKARGAVVLHRDVEYTLVDDAIVVDGSAGSVLIDRGVHAHDPTQPLRQPAPATSLSRPPFPWRPVVAFVAGDPAGELAEWARALVNDLLGFDVEGRLVMNELAAGPHLTAACTPDDQSIGALRPDIIVPLDQWATTQGRRWADEDGSLQVIDFVDDLASGVEPVSWRLGASSGRVRARMGRAVEASALATMVQRLCAGPHPLELDESVETTRREWREGIGSIVSAIRAPSRPAAVASRTIMALSGSPDECSHLEGLLDHLDAAGQAIDLRHVRNGWPDDLESADLLLLHAVAAADAQELVQRRRSLGRPSVAHVSGDAEAVDLARLCGLSISANEEVAAQLSARGVRAQAMPTLLTRDRDAELRRLRRQQTTPDHVLGWRIEQNAEHLALQAVAKAVNQLLQDDEELELVIIDGGGDGPDLGDRVVVVHDHPSASEASHWLAQVWSTPEGSAVGAEDHRPLVEASHMGLPTVLEAGNPAARISRHPTDLVVDRPADSDAWIDAIRPLVLDPADRARHSREIARHSDALNGAAAAATVVSRFLGWLDRSTSDG